MQIFKSHHSSDGLMRDYCDGSHFKAHPLFAREPNALQIQLYFDEIDVCNPIGAKAVIHKLGEYRWLTCLSR